jgi:hypothetical protein
MVYNDVTGNLPTNYNSLELRKRIALAQLMQKRAYPKTFGEGLSSAGDSIMDAFTIKALERQQREYDAAKLKEKEAEEKGPKAEGADLDDASFNAKYGKPGAEFIEPQEPTVQQAALSVQQPDQLPPMPLPQPPAPQPPPAPPPPPQVERQDPLPPQALSQQAASMSPSQNPLLNQYPIEPQANSRFPGPDVASPMVDPALAMQQPSQGPTSGPGGMANAPAWFGQTVANGMRMQGPQPIGGSQSPSGMPPGLPPQPPPEPPQYPGASYRDSIASLMTPQPGQEGGPPQNPMMAGQTPARMPSSLPGLMNPMQTATAGSPPEAAQNRPIVMRDIEPGPRLEPGAQLAQAPMTGRPRVYVNEPAGQAKGVQVPAVRPAPLPETTPGPAERGQAEGIYDKPVEPKPFMQTQKSKEETRYEREERYATDPDMKSYYAKKAADLATIRAAQDARLLEEYKNKYQLYGQDLLKWQDAQRLLPKTQAETAQEQSKASVMADQAVISSRHGGMPAEKVFADLAERQKQAKSAADTLKQAKIARQAIDAGIFSGPLANLQLDKARLEAWMLKNKNAGDLASNSEMYRTAVNSMLGQAIKNFQPGGGPVTEGDIRIAQGQVGSTPELMEQTKRKILNNFISQLHGDLAGYEDRVGRSLGGLKAEPHFEVDRPPLHNDPEIEKQYVDRLIKNKDNLAVRNKFDELFGEGAAALEIARARRRGAK